MFKVNDKVLYGAQGICVIDDVTEKSLGNTTAKYYVLKPVYQENSKIFVPVDNKNLTSRMRRIMSREEINDLIHAMPENETAWIDDDMVRRKQYRDALSCGDRFKTAAVIKALYFEQCRRKKEGKKLHQSDEILLHQAETLLYNELALVLDIKPEQVIDFLNEQIGIDELEKKDV